MSANSPGADAAAAEPIARSFITAVAAGLVFALAGVAFSLHVIAVQLIPHIVAPGNGLAFVEAVAGRPVPQMVDWSYTQIGLMIELRDMSAPWMIAACALIFGTLWVLSVRIVNPTFRPLYYKTEENPLSNGAEGKVTTANPTGASNTPFSTHIVVDRVHLAQVFRLLVAAGLPVLAVWYVTGGFGNEPLFGSGHPSGGSAALQQFLRLSAVGIALFVGFSCSGAAGRFGILHQVYQSDETAIPPRHGVNIAACVLLALTGVVFGACLWALEKLSVGPPTEEVMDRFHMLGTFNRVHLGIVSRPYIIAVALCGFGAGALIYLLGRPGLKISTRLALTVLPIAAAVILAGSKRPLTTAALAARYDELESMLTVLPFDAKRPTASVPEGEAAGREFAKRVPLITAQMVQKTPSVNMIAFDPRQTFEVELPKITDDGLIIDSAKASAVQSFLQKRQYQSALSWVAIKYLFNDANLRFDSSAAIRACLDDLENTPHVFSITNTLRSLFFLCPASPKNYSLLNEYADESRFNHATRESQRMMGDLYNRFGEVSKAMEWYKRADMPSSFMQRVRSEKPLFHTGTVTGKLTWNGVPLIGAQVGVAPQKLNGLPRDLEPTVFYYARELASIEPERSPFYSPYHPRPFRLRWISGGTTTNRDGSFTIDHLTEGAYFLVCTLPPGAKVDVPLDPKLTIGHVPPAFTVSYENPKQDLGVVSFSYKK